MSQTVRELFRERLLGDYFAARISSALAEVERVPATKLGSAAGAQCVRDIVDQFGVAIPRVDWEAPKISDSFGGSIADDFERPGVTVEFRYGYQGTQDLLLCTPAPSSVRTYPAAAFGPDWLAFVFSGPDIDDGKIRAELHRRKSLVQLHLNSMQEPVAAFRADLEVAVRMRVVERQRGIIGTAAKVLSRKPEFWEHLDSTLVAFLELSNSRKMGVGGPKPIAHSDVVGYCDLAGISDPHDREEFIQVIKAMDLAWLRRAGEKAKSSLDPLQ